MAQQEIREQWAHRCESNGSLGIVNSLKRSSGKRPDSYPDAYFTDIAKNVLSERMPGPAQKRKVVQYLGWRLMLQSPLVINFSSCSLYSLARRHAVF